MSKDTQKEKKILTAEQLYKKNRQKSKVFKRLAPVVYWLFLALVIVFLIFTISNSVGNVVEIINMLDKDSLTGTEVAENYTILVERYGEWTLAGGEGSVYEVRFINIGKALFNGIMITYLILTIVCLVVAVVVGKIVLPKLAQLYSDSNQDMVNIATLQTNAEVKKRKNKDEEWF